MTSRNTTVIHRNQTLCAGVDEAGRGPLAGPVVIAAVILDPSHSIRGLADSKCLSEKRRQLLAEKIRRRALAWRVESIDVEVIDEINILQATLLGMRQAVEGLDPLPASLPAVNRPAALV